MWEKAVAVLIGYLFGCFLTAEAVARHYAGKSAGQLGDTGNPGMANIMASLGFKPGILTLAGDLGKVCLAAGAVYFLFSGKVFPGLLPLEDFSGDRLRILIFYSGAGCTLGHDFPFWRKLRGGKGVATTSMAITLYAVWPGLASNIIGMLVVFATKYLCIGGLAIPLSFAVWMFVRGDMEAGGIAAVLTLLSVYAHSGSMRGIRNGTTKKTDVPGAIKKKLGYQNEDHIQKKKTGG